MPTTPRKARVLLKQGKAKVVSRIPFVIQLTIAAGETKQDVVAGIDSGSKVIGSACISNGEVVYQSEIYLRNDIRSKMDRRRKYRRTRRNRLRYRKPRWNNRSSMKRSDRLSPTILSKLNSHLKENKFIESILPVSLWKVETASFDIHKLSDPNVGGKGYQNGELKDYYNTKAFVLHRNNYKCQCCKGKSKDKRLHVHHIVWRKNGGSNHQDNLITVCRTCHDLIHKGKIELNLKGHKTKTKHATEISILKSQLKKKFGEFVETFGYETKFKREQILNLSKTHYNDAVAICCEEGELVKPLKTILIKRCISKGDYQQTKGTRSEKRIPADKIFGFRKFDKVLYQGQEYFIKGRMSSGYAVLMSIFGDKVNIKPIPKFSRMRRLQSRKSWIIDQRTTVNIC